MVVIADVRVVVTADVWVVQWVGRVCSVGQDVNQERAWNTGPLRDCGTSAVLAGCIRQPAMRWQSSALQSSLTDLACAVTVGAGSVC